MLGSTMPSAFSSLCTLGKEEEEVVLGGFSVQAAGCPRKREPSAGPPRCRRRPWEVCSGPAQSLPTTSPVGLGRVQSLQPQQPPQPRESSGPQPAD